MPKDNIERAIKRGTGELEGGELIELLYEAYGPHGIGFIIEVVTDNKNRAVADLRHALTKHDGNMAESGAVSWQFTRKGYIAISEEVDEDELFLIAADAGADDIQFEDDVTEIYTPLETFTSARDAVKEAGYAIEEASMIYDPNNPLALTQAESVQVLKLVEVLEDLDDVQNIYSSLDISDEALAALEAAG